MNLPKSHLSAPSLTDKDEVDLKFGLSNDVEWVALSFVREEKDIHILRDKNLSIGFSCRHSLLGLQEPDPVVGQAWMSCRRSTRQPT